MKRLILIPTRAEREVVEPLLTPHLSPEDEICLCGFGLVAAAARTGALVADVHPDRVFLVGIAGSLVDTTEIGSACSFSGVACYGIGAGSGHAHISVTNMGWSHWEGIGDEIALSENRAEAQLLSVTAASTTIDEAKRRRSQFPQATAEDMEGFSVALACRMTDTPLTIVRGISNRAGQRDKSEWRIRAALEAAAGLLADLL